nr:unnamed protein product [Callosobruchus analis]
MWSRITVAKLTKREIGERRDTSRVPSNCACVCWGQNHRERASCFPPADRRAARRPTLDARRRAAPCRAWRLELLFRIDGRDVNAYRSKLEILQQVLIKPLIELYHNWSRGYLEYAVIAAVPHAPVSMLNQ